MKLIKEKEVVAEVLPTTNILIGGDQDAPRHDADAPELESNGCDIFEYNEDAQRNPIPNGSEDVLDVLDQLLRPPSRKMEKAKRLPREKQRESNSTIRRGPFEAPDRDGLQCLYDEDQSSPKEVLKRENLEEVGEMEHGEFNPAIEVTPRYQKNHRRGL